MIVPTSPCGNIWKGLINQGKDQSLDELEGREQSLTSLDKLVLNISLEEKGKKILRFFSFFSSFSNRKNSNIANPTGCGKCYLASRKSGPWDDSMKMESSTELTACTWWVILPSSSANSMAPHSATRALNLLYTCIQFAVHSTAHKRRGLKVTSLD